jgi:hypothetical protein
MQRGKIILAAVLALATLAANSTGYHVFKKVALPGAGGWDYLTVDESARRLYVSRATQAVVLDADSLEIVGKIPDLSGVHGIAVAPEFGRGFITALEVIPTVQGAKTMTLDRKTQRLFVPRENDAISLWVLQR